MNIQTQSFIPIDTTVLKNIIHSKINTSDFIWINQLSFSATNSNGVTNVYVYAPNTFCRDYIITNCQKIIDSSIRGEYPFVTDIKYFVGMPQTENSVFANSNFNDDNYSENTNNSIFGVNENNINNRGLINTYKFENFVTTNINELAAVACRQISNIDIETFNQIYIYGKSGVGKTHLLHAIGNRIISLKPDAKVLYMTAEKFMYSFIKHSKEKTLIEFKDDLRNAYCLIVDDVHFLSGRESTENEFFHTINELKQMNKKIVLSGNESPFLIDGLSKVLANEIASNLTIEIPVFNTELRKKIIEKKLNINGVNLSNDVIEFLALKQLNAKQLDGAIKRIFMYSSLTDIDLNVTKINTLLSDLFYTSETCTNCSIVDIKKYVCDFFGISITKLDSYIKEKNISTPRQIAMYLSKKFTNKTFNEIGKMFGGKNHATVLYAVKKIENLMNNDINFSRQIETIENLIQGCN